MWCKQNKKRVLKPGARKTPGTDACGEQGTGGRQGTAKEPRLLSRWVRSPLPRERRKEEILDNSGGGLFKKDSVRPVSRGQHLKENVLVVSESKGWACTTPRAHSLPGQSPASLETWPRPSPTKTTFPILLCSTTCSGGWALTNGMHATANGLCGMGALAVLLPGRALAPG